MGPTTGTVRDGMYKAEDDTILARKIFTITHTATADTQCVGYPLLTLPVSTTGVEFQQQETTA